MSIPTPVIPEEIADSQSWTKTTFAQEAAGTVTPSAGNGLVNGNNPYMAWQDTSVSPNRWFQYIDTGQGFVLQTGTGSTYASVVWTTVWQITDVTQSTIYEVLTALTRDSRSMGVPGAVGATPFANRIFVGSEGQPRYTQGTGGDMAWGAGGSSATDAFLARVAAGVMQFTGLVRQTGTPAGSTDLTTKNYVDTQDNLHLLLSGGTLTGALVLAADPTLALGASTKQYVDGKVGAGLFAEFTGAGAPAAGTLSAAITYVVGNLYLDTTNLVLYVCTTGGSNSTSVWTAVGAVTSVAATADNSLIITPTTGAVTAKANATSLINGMKLDAFYTGAGDPGAGTLAAGTYGQGDIYLDTTNNYYWMCLAGGSNSAAIWGKVFVVQDPSGSTSLPTGATHKGPQFFPYVELFSNDSSGGPVIIQTLNGNLILTANIMRTGTSGVNDQWTYVVTNPGMTWLIGQGAIEARMYASGTGNTKADTNEKIAIQFVPNTARTAINSVFGVNAALATNATDGFVYLPTSAGVPTGTPTAFTGMAPVIYDTTNNQLWAFNSTWKTLSQSIARAHNSVNQSIPNNTNTALSFDTNDINTNGIWSAGNPTRFTAKITGNYMVFGGIEWASNATGIRNITFRKNGTTFGFAAYQVQAVTDAATVTTIGVFDIIHLTSGDYMEVIGFQTSGGNLNADGNVAPTFGGLLYLG